MTNQESANLLTLCGEEVTRKGYSIYNHNGDYLYDLSEGELDFVQNHQCTSDCRRIGCDLVGVNS